MTQTSLETASARRIRDVVAPMFAARGLTVPSDPAADLRVAGLTSLDMVNLMLAIEGEFDVFIPQEKITTDNFRSIDAMRSLVESLVE